MEQTKNGVSWINSKRNKDNITNNVVADRNSNPQPVSLPVRVVMSSSGEYS